MKITSLVVLSLMAMSAYAEDKLNNEKYVTQTKVESFDLSQDELNKLSKKQTVTIDTSVKTFNINVRKHHPAMAQAVHTACFNTWYTVNGEYIFTLEVGGKSVVYRQTIVAPARRRTCVTHQSYQEVTFNVSGNYFYTASSSANSLGTGNHTVTASSLIFVS